MLSSTFDLKKIRVCIRVMRHIEDRKPLQRRKVQREIFNDDEVIQIREKCGYITI
jgi:hypothetical protein